MNFSEHTTNPVTEMIARQVVETVAIDKAPLQKTIAQALSGFEKIVLVIEKHRTYYMIRCSSLLIEHLFTSEEKAKQYIKDNYPWYMDKCCFFPVRIKE